MSFTAQQFQDTVQRALDARSRQYSRYYALTIRWEADSNPLRDTTCFATLLKSLDFPILPSELVLSRNDISPWITVAFKLMHILNDANSAPGRAIVLLHYGGHGDLNANGELIFGSCTGQSFSYDESFNHWCGRNTIVIKRNSVDIMLFLDCCYSGTVTRALPPASRTFEVFAATDANNPNANAPVRTFTAELAAEIALLKSQGATYIDFAELYAHLVSQSPTIKPLHRIILGDSSIRLLFRLANPASSTNLNLFAAKAATSFFYFPMFFYSLLCSKRCYFLF